MMRMFLTYVGLIGWAAVLGPLSVTISTVSKSDPSNLYLVVGSQRTFDSVLSKPNAREIGPERAHFATFLYAPSDLHQSLVQQGYWIFPATSLAAICGIRPNI